MSISQSSKTSSSRSATATDPRLFVLLGQLSLDEKVLVLTGWAVPVYRGTLSDEFVEELNAVE